MGCSRVRQDRAWKEERRKKKEERRKKKEERRKKKESLGENGMKPGVGAYIMA